jgi:KUP system potassium uptake protein
MGEVERSAAAATQGASAARNEEAPDGSKPPRAGRADGEPPASGSPPISKSRPEYKRLLGLALMATGVVFGDIGTSPLYAFRLNFGPEVGLAPTPDHVLGIASLIFWSLTLVISIKYLLLVLRADDDGEGGILVMLTRARPWRHGTARPFLMVAGLVGAALLYADGVITPAISVLSALEGLSHFNPTYEPAVLPATVAALFVLFLLQHRGTRGVGRLFGPIVATWFIVIALLGLTQLARQPQVLWALDPTHAITLLFESGWQGLVVIGTVFLVVTGGEALYADLGHFGKLPIRLAWYGLAYPCLLLSYFGQAALALETPDLAAQSFYALAPPWALGPLLALATAATCIASQAIISATFSLTRQAIELGYLPKMHVVQTSHRYIGRVYVPAINWFLMVATLMFVVGFGSSDSLGGAYGIAISLAMLIETFLLSVVMIDRWSWSLPVAAAVALPFLMLDALYFVGNSLKIASGGWAPLVIAAIVCQLMIVWRTGERTLSACISRPAVPSVSLENFEARLREANLPRIPGTGVFLSRKGEMPPLVLTRAVEKLGTLHERTVLVTVVNEYVPRIRAARGIALEDRGNGLYIATLRYGFMQAPDIPKALRLARFGGEAIDPAEINYFILHGIALVPQAAGLRGWLQRLFAVLERNFEGLEHDNIPPEQVFTVGMALDLPSNVSQRHGLELDNAGDRRDRDSRVSTRGLP